jgi:hypothetical protein
MHWEDGKRPPLSYETLQGYRLFFHPDEREALRRSLLLQVPEGARLKQAYLLIRPYQPKSRKEMAWLRVEGYREFGYVRFDWDGTYRRDEFPDGLYGIDLRVTWEGGEEKRWRLVVAKSQDYPRFVKAAGSDLDRQRGLSLTAEGEFASLREELTISKAQHPSVDLVGRVWLPGLEGDFSLSGALVQMRSVSSDGKSWGSWQCLSRQDLPADSPARSTAKKVAFAWDVRDLSPGLYDLRLALYHGLSVNARRDQCDVPLLDGDVLRLRLAE